MPKCAFCDAYISPENVTGQCGRHRSAGAISNRRLSMGTTPKGEAYLRVGNAMSPAGPRSRFAREFTEPIPPSSLGIRNFPYFTEEERDRYLTWLETGDITHRPNSSLALRDFPIRSEECSRDRVNRHNLVGIVDERTGDVVEVECRLGEESTDMVDTYLTSSGERYCLSRTSHRTVQVVVIDDDLIRGSVV